MRIIQAVPVAKPTQVDQALAAVETIIGDTTDKPDVSSALRDLRREIVELKKQSPRYYIEYDVDARRHFLDEIRSTFNTRSRQEAYADALIMYGKDYFQPDLPIWNRELARFLMEYFNDTHNTIWTKEAAQ